MGILQNNHDQNSIKRLTAPRLEELCADIREEIIKVTYLNGGHLSSNLGVVELTVALCKVFNFPTDKILFDVGHQCYAYKLITDRYDRFSSIRTEGGLSGFPSLSESEYDGISAGHAGTSIAAGLGYCSARDSAGEDYYVISVVGDASFFNGESFEAVSFQDKKPNKFLVVLNDNRMSISPNSNGLYRAISNLTTKKLYKKTNDLLSRSLGKCFIGKFLRKIKHGLKRTLSFNTLADKLGLKYVGEYDGHNLKDLVKILTRIKESGEPALLHVRTVKGKGYSPAETDCTAYHGVGAKLALSKNEFSSAVFGMLESAVEKYPRLVAVTAGMSDGTGLKEFSEKYPKNFTDVGIAEEFAVTYSAGVAAGGGLPVVFVYSAFLQRAYDQILNDVCLNGLHVVFCIDRAGLVGSDGKTHQGAFDISYLSAMPGLTLFCPKSAAEFKDCFNLALTLNNPVAIRYPNGSGFNLHPQNFKEEKITKDLKWEVVFFGGLAARSGAAENCNLPRDNGFCGDFNGDFGAEYAFFACGPRTLEIALGAAEKLKNAVVINARVIKPLDETMLLLFKNCKIITLEEGVKSGGFGDSVLRFFANIGAKVKIKTLGLADGFTDCATVSAQLNENGLSVQAALDAANSLRD